MTLHTCPNCGTLNNKIVNDERCYDCGNEWKGLADVEVGP